MNLHAQENRFADLQGANVKRFPEKKKKRKREGKKDLQITKQLS